MQSQTKASVIRNCLVLDFERLLFIGIVKAQAGLRDCVRTFFQYRCVGDGGGRLPTQPTGRSVEGSACTLLCCSASLLMVFLLFSLSRWSSGSMGSPWIDGITNNPTMAVFGHAGSFHLSAHTATSCAVFDGPWN